MPYLQLDVNGRYPVEDKKRLAAKLCETYANLMSVDSGASASRSANAARAASGAPWTARLSRCPC